MVTRSSAILAIVNGVVVLLTVGWLVFGAGGVLVHRDLLAWRADGDRSFWPDVTAQRLSIRLDPPGGFAVDAELELAGVDGRFALLLDKDLHVSAARDDQGRAVGVAHGMPLFERYHREGRCVLFTPAEAPDDGRMTLRLSYGGTGASGTHGSDWRGILFVDVDQVRMCEQTMFWPQVPSAPQSPSVVPVPTELLVDAPDDLELYAPGALVARRPIEGQAGRQQWHFKTDRPCLPSLVGGRLVRGEAGDEHARLVTLLRPEHAHLEDAFLAETERAFRYYTGRFGPTTEGSLGIFEMHCRSGSSYNWAAEGVIAFDSRAINDEVPVAKLAHEVAHLWFGQKLQGRGDGERFLTESLSEAASWRYLRARGQAETLGWKIDAARKSYRRIADGPINLPLRAVRFGVPWYDILAYEKGALVGWYLINTLGEDVFDEAVRALMPRGSLTLDDFVAALAEAADDPGLAVPWIDQLGDLDLSVEDVSWNAAASRLEGRVVATPVPAATPFEVQGRVSVSVRRDGQVQRHVIELTGATTAFALALDGEPSSVTFDPGRLWPLSPHELVVFDGARLLASSPEDGSEPAHGQTRLELIFDRPLAPVELDELRSRARSAVEGDARVPGLLSLELLDEGRRLVLHTRPWSPSRDYQLPLRACLTDTRGDPVFTRALAFRTASSDDTTAPSIAASVPASGARGVAPGLEEIRITFDEPMMTMTGFHGADIRRLAGDGLQFPDLGELAWSDDGRELVFQVGGSLEPGRTYVLPFREKRWKDLSGNGLVPLDLTFTVGDGP